MHDQIEPRRRRAHGAVIEALGKNTSTAKNTIAVEAARYDHHLNRTPGSGRSARRR